MLIAERIRAIREAKNLSQADIEERTGLLRSYLSRVENGHTVPAVETLQKLARGLEVPLYHFFYEGENPPRLPNLLRRRKEEENAWGSSRKETRYWQKFRRLVAHMKERDRKVLLFAAQKMARRSRALRPA